MFGDDIRDGALVGLDGPGHEHPIGGAVVARRLNRSAARPSSWPTSRRAGLSSTSTPSPVSSATIGLTRRSLRPVCVTSVGSQPVLATPTSTRHVSAPSRVDRRVSDLEARRAQRLVDGELGVRCDLGAQQVGRRVVPHVERRSSRRARPVRAAGGRTGTSRRGQSGWCSSHHRSTASASSSVGPRYQKWVDCLWPVAAMDDVPVLGRPAVDAEVLVGPVVGGAAHRVRRIPREVLEHRVRRVAGERGAALGELLPRPDVTRRQASSRRRSTRAAGSPRPTCGRRCSRRCSGRATMARTSASISGSLSGWSPLPGTPGAPAGGEVAVEVERLRRPWRRDREVVVVVDGSFDGASGSGAMPGGGPSAGTGISNRWSSGCGIHAPSGSAIRMPRIRPSPSMSSTWSPGKRAPSRHGHGRTLERRNDGRSASTHSAPSGLTRGTT